MCIVTGNVVATFLAVGPEAHVKADFPARVGPALANDSLQCAAINDCPTSFVSEFVTKVGVCRME